MIIDPALLELDAGVLCAHLLEHFARSVMQLGREACAPIKVSIMPCAGLAAAREATSIALSPRTTVDLNYTKRCNPHSFFVPLMTLAIDTHLLDYIELI